MRRAPQKYSLQVIYYTRHLLGMLQLSQPRVELQELREEDKRNDGNTKIKNGEKRLSKPKNKRKRLNRQIKIYCK
jgi:hypothetical protein